MATSSPDPSDPTAAQLVELAHRSTAEAPGPSLIHVRLDPAAEAVDLGIAGLGADRHPADALVGFRAPAAWDAVGITSTGTVHDRSGAGVPSARGRFTTLAFRDRPGATVVERTDGRLELLAGDPTGWAADVLRRVLGLPTAPPDGSTALLIDVWWLDALVTTRLRHPARRPGWRWMAQLHPLCPPGTVVAPEELQALAAAEARSRPWATLRRLLTDRDLPAAAVELPEGTVLPGHEWFDDGSLCRWLLRTTHPPEALLGELIEQLPAHLTDRVLAGLVEVDLGAAA